MSFAHGIYFGGHIFRNMLSLSEDSVLRPAHICFIGLESWNHTSKLIYGHPGNGCLRCFENTIAVDIRTKIQITEISCLLVSSLLSYAVETLVDQVARKYCAFHVNPSGQTL